MELSMSPKQRQIGVGVIGCGGFGLFALQHFAQVPGIRLVAMAETHREAAQAAVRRFGLPDVMELDALLRMPRLDLVYIATPPFPPSSPGDEGFAGRQARSGRETYGPCPGPSG
jgi:hypothetical protein